MHFVRAALAGLSLAITATAFAQARVSTVAMVLSRDELGVESGFREYLVKRNVPIKFETVRFSGRAEDGPELVAQLRRMAPDLVYSWGTGATLAIAGIHDDPRPQDFIRDIPIVFTEVTDPVGARLLRQLNPPGRNLTGVSHVPPMAVQLNAIRSYRPLARLGYVTNPREPSSLLVLHEIRKLAGAMKFTIIEETLPLDAAGDPDPSAVPGVIRAMAARKVDFLYIGSSAFLAFTHRDLVTQAALEARVPTFCTTEIAVRQGKCMFGLFANSSNLGRFAGYKAAQILVDKVPVARIPAESPQGFSLLINMPVVKALQLYPPLSLLNVAEAVE
jgi:putative ABC transport system substrate-binding protein